MQIIILKIILDSNDGTMLSCMELIKMEFLISKELIRDYRIGKLGTSFKNQGRIQEVHKSMSELKILKISDRNNFHPFTGDTVSFYYCGGTMTWSYEGALILLKKKDNMPELIENSEVLIEHSATVTGFDSSNYCRLKYTGKLSN